MKQARRMQGHPEPSDTIIYGINAVMALLADPNRVVSTLTLLKGGATPRLQALLALARARGVHPRFVARAALDQMTEQGVHQGVAAQASVRQQPGFDEILARLDTSDRGLLVILDGMEDPRNLGAIIRSAEAFGAMAVIVPKDRTAPLSSVAIKASAGAGERVDVVRVVNVARAIDALRQHGVYVYGLAGEGTTRLEGFSFIGTVALVLGSEGKGLRRLTRERCDALLAISMHGQVGSLNVAVAAGIGLYEVQKCRVSP